MTRFSTNSIIILLFIFATAVSGFAQNGWRSRKIEKAGDLVAVDFINSKRGFIAGDDGFLAVTNDGGVSWTKQDIGTQENINEIYFRNEKNGYLVAGRKLFITADSGNSWRETVIFSAGEFREGVPEFLSIRFADKNRGHAIGSVLNKKDEVIDSLVMRTDDGGQTWHRIKVPSKRELFHLDFSGKSDGWIVGDHGIILATRDGGISWKPQNWGTVRALYNVDFQYDNIGYAVGGGGTILRTENGGETWVTSSSNVMSTLLRVDFADSKNGWIVGRDGTVLRSSDKGKTWLQQASNTKAHIYGLYMMKKTGWAVGQNGILFEYDR